MAGEYAKNKAKRFFAKLLESDEEKHSIPPRPPPKPAGYHSGSGSNATPTRPSNDNALSTSSPSYDFVQSFDRLRLSEQHASSYSYSPPPPPSFVGGFNPQNLSPGPLPRPPAMPMPMPATSLTMQYALNRPPPQVAAPSFLDASVQAASRPHSLPPPSNNESPFVSPQPSPALNASTSSAGPSPSARTQGKPRQRRSNSAPGTETCSGFTKAGKRCTREVKSRGPAFAYRMTGEADTDIDGNLSSEGVVERYCHQHIKDFIGATGTASGFYARKWMGEGSQRGDEVWVSFADFIPSYLSPETQVALRVEMEKARSAKDTEGYIYTFEIRDPDSPQIRLKTGRTTHLARRLDQWSKQCSSKELVLRGWLPGGVDPETGLPATSHMKGRVDAGQKGPSCHRLERLIHLELADLVAEGQYLRSDWKSFRRGQPQIIDVDADDALATPSKKPAAASMGSGPKCPDCGSQHKEIFTFTRLKKGPYKGKEWELIVKPVVERWAKFVEEHVG